jgi:hypothetical protein
MTAATPITMPNVVSIARIGAPTSCAECDDLLVNPVEKSYTRISRHTHDVVLQRSIVVGANIA